MSATGYDSGGSPFTKTVNVYIANGGYTSQAWDSPASRHYDAWISGRADLPPRDEPRRSGGKATTGFGSLVVSNPAPDTSSRPACATTGCA
jgi:hypothetical protein